MNVSRFAGNDIEAITYSVPTTIGVIIISNFCGNRVKLEMKNKKHGLVFYKSRMEK